ncbi:hypothetical protein SHLI107390_20900 [Shewanella livingstonensis]
MIIAQPCWSLELKIASRADSAPCITITFDDLILNMLVFCFNLLKGTFYVSKSTQTRCNSILLFSIIF